MGEKKETNRTRKGEGNLILFHYSTQLKNIIFCARATWACLFFILQKNKTINIVYREKKGKKKNRKKSEDFLPQFYSTKKNNSYLHHILDTLRFSTRTHLTFISKEWYQYPILYNRKEKGK